MAPVWSCRTTRTGASRDHPWGSDHHRPPVAAPRHLHRPAGFSAEVPQRPLLRDQVLQAQQPRRLLSGRTGQEWRWFAQAALSRSVGGRFCFRDEPGGWWISVEPEIEIAPHEVHIPDLAGWRREQVPKPPDERPVRAVPDWVCEVVSPSTERLDRVAKAAGCLGAGVPFYWLVDVAARVLEALASRDGSWVRLGAWSDGDAARIPPSDSIQLEVGRLFPPPG